MSTLATELVRKTTGAGEKLKAKKVKPDAPVEPRIFRCILHPELMFKVGGEVIMDGYGRQRTVRRGHWRRFVNTMFIARTAEELEYCLSKGWIFEEPAIPESAKDENGNYDPELDPRQYWEDPDTGFKTHNKQLWSAYIKKLRS